jgi:hypothetical protein
MLHHYISDYKAGYCLKKDKEGSLHCRFYFSTDLLGFVPKYEDDMDGRRPYLVKWASTTSQSRNAFRF